MTRPKRGKVRRDEWADRFVAPIPLAVNWPSTEWRYDPVRFAREVLGIEWVSARQRSLLESIAEDTFITVRGGRKSGKTRAAIIGAWWYVKTFPDARVFLVAPTLPSVTQITWRDVMTLHNRSPVDLGGKLHTNPLTGWVDGLSGIYGRVSRDAGGIRGISGANVMYIVDEASDVKDEIFETIDGNMAGGIGEGRNSKVLLVSNPTELIGFFHESHTRDSRFTRHHLPAEAQNSRPGMASREWLEAQLAKHGEESDYYQIHILGNFPSTDHVRFISETLLEAAEADWENTEEAGDLAVGLDPAFSDENDEAGFAVRRGRKILCVDAYRGQSADSLVSLAMAYINQHRKRGEPVKLIVDADGPVGQKTVAALRPACTKANVKLVALHFRLFPRMFPTIARSYADISAARWGMMSDFLRNDGVLPFDRKLHDELLFAQRGRANDGRMTVQHKDDFRDALKRSPDRADAVLNACWRWDPTAPVEIQKSYSPPQSHSQGSHGGYDPYSGAWNG